jgi:hypothetical protein
MLYVFALPLKLDQQPTSTGILYDRFCVQNCAFNTLQKALNRSCRTIPQGPEDQSFLPRSVGGGKRSVRDAAAFGTGALGT